jgi:nucleotide-binding universal stress UspA family protein
VYPPPAVLELAAENEDAVQHDRALGRLQSFAGSLPSGLHTRLHPLPGAPPGRAITRFAAGMGADLLVVGSHGRSRLERLMLGSVSETVVRLAPCPTLVIPPRADDAVDGAAEFGHILCAVDFSDASLRALEYALTMAEEADAELTVLHVQDGQIEADRQRIMQLIPDGVRSYCTVEAVLRQGVVHREIAALAAERRADLIVMGFHGHGAINRVMFGSNTARVVREAACPVLIVTGR